MHLFLVFRLPQKRWYNINMHGVIAKNTLFQALARIATSAVTLIVTILIARTFGVVGYGDFTKITTFVGIFYLVVDFGLNAVFLQRDTKNGFRDLLYLRLGLALLFLIILNAVAFVLPSYNFQIGFSPFVKLGIFIFSFSLLAQAILFSSSALFQKRLRFDLFMKSQAIGAFVTLLLVLIFITFSFSLYYILLAFILGGMTSGWVALRLTQEKIFPIEVHVSIAKGLITESLPLAGMLIFNLIYFRIDVLLLSLLRPTADVGVYGIAMRFFDFLIALPLFLSNSLYPIFIESQKNKRSGVLVLKTYLFVSVVCSFVLVLVFWFLAPLLSLIKPDFSFAVLPFRILLLSLPVFFATSLLQWMLIAQKKQKFLLVMYLLSAIANIFLNLVFIPTGSYIASAIITGVCEAFVLLILAYLVFVKKLSET